MLTPSEAELAAGIDARGEPRSPPLALGLVYPDLIGVVATSRALAAAQAGLSIPRDNRCLVEATTHPGALLALAEELDGPFAEAWKFWAGVKAPMRWMHGGLP